MKSLKLHFGLILVLLIFSSANAFGKLPLSVNGQQMPTLAPLVKRTVPAVVNITNIAEVRLASPRTSPYGFYNSRAMRWFKTRSVGSGVIVDAKNGYILTNDHVIARPKKITVRLRGRKTKVPVQSRGNTLTVSLSDGRKYPAKLIGTDPASDVAVIQIKAKNLTQLKLGDSDKLRVGDFVLAIGNPLGLSQTVTSGIVSGLKRSNLGIERYEDFIQTDAAINTGNSGGALINLRGELIGINTAIISRSGDNSGIGLAIPINMAQKLMHQILKYGEVRRGLLGVHIQSLSAQLARAFQLAPDTKGVLINRVIRGSAADKAGLRVGDVIFKVNGKPVTTANTLRNKIGLMSVGQKVELDFYRASKTKRTVATLGSTKTPVTALRSPLSIHPKLRGAAFGPIPKTSRLYGHFRGVMVLSIAPGSPAAQNGLRRGDVIISVNRRTVTSVVQLKRASAANRKQILLHILRGESAMFVLLQ